MEQRSRDIRGSAWYVYAHHKLHQKATYNYDRHTHELSNHDVHKILWLTLRVEKKFQEPVIRELISAGILIRLHKQRFQVGPVVEEAIPQ